MIILILHYTSHAHSTLRTIGRSRRIHSLWKASPVLDLAAAGCPLQLIRNTPSSTSYCILRVIISFIIEQIFMDTSWFLFLFVASLPCLHKAALLFQPIPEQRFPQNYKRFVNLPKPGAPIIAPLSNNWLSVNAQSSSSLHCSRQNNCTQYFTKAVAFKKEGWAVTFVSGNNCRLFRPRCWTFVSNAGRKAVGRARTLLNQVPPLFKKLFQTKKLSKI